MSVPSFYDGYVITHLLNHHQILWSDLMDGKTEPECDDYKKVDGEKFMKTPEASDYITNLRKPETTSIAFTITVEMTINPSSQPKPARVIRRETSRKTTTRMASALNTELTMIYRHAGFSSS